MSDNVSKYYKLSQMFFGLDNNFLSLSEPFKKSLLKRKLNENGFYSSDENVLIMEKLLDSGVLKNREKYVYEEEHNYATGESLAKLFKRRYIDSEKSDKNFDREMRIWVKSSPYFIIENLLPKLIRFYNRSNFNDKIDFNDLIHSLMLLNYDKNEIISKICDSYAVLEIKRE